jgi:Protein of unknown function (DUF2845)
MHMKKGTTYFISLVFLATALVSAILVSADEETSMMTCDEGVVNIGDAGVDVLATCGQPNIQSMHEWIYNFGPSQPVYTVIFKDGQVVRILESEAGN